MIFLNSHEHLSLSHFCFGLHFLPSNLHLHLHDISFVKIFDLFFPLSILKTCIFKSSLFFGTHTLLDKSLRVLKLPTNLSELTANG